MSGLDPARPATYDRAFALGTALNGGFVVIEAVAGVVAGSTALLADAAHNFSDVLGLLLAWGASRLARRPRSARRTYGWRSSSILAALLNAILLLVVTGGVAWEAIRRFWSPATVGGGVVAWVAFVGMAINAATALLFLRGREGDLNVRGAFLHLAADAAVSAGVVLAGLAILATGRTWIDPLTTLVIAVVILGSTWGLLRQSVNLALHAVPEWIDPAAVEAYLAALPGVTAVHDLHIWAMSTTETALTAHLVKRDAHDDDAIMAEATRVLHDRFGIHHTTLQWERGAGACCPRLPV
ncbi:MAG TPA: cation diffusion facilitator family transporter [Vicinamibacterales bacterium]|nr:cation diffusion facilitator family transporter [Vicinamibacterales bacterium]HPW20466.1 cation diffusion facilitator family transporter [Vicinamibacterales bacterium]